MRARPALRSLLGAGVGLLMAASAAAQAPPPAPGRGIDLTAGLRWSGPSTLGTAEATLFGADGSPLLLFKSTSRAAPAAGLEVHVTVPLARRLAAEATVAWTPATLETRVANDFELADPVTITDRTAQFDLEASALWTIATRGRAEFFARGGGGWTRQVTGDRALVEGGGVGTAGGGMKYWWRQGGAGRLKRAGLRVEGRAAIRSGGLTTGDASVRVTPVLTAAFIMGF